MNYYYDIVLNFLENNYMFYEWDELDDIEYIKKIPLFQVSSQVFKDFYSNNIMVDGDFLKCIENKTIKRDGNLKFACILADKNNAFAYEFDEDGNIITRSSLVLIDELNLLDYLYTIPIKDINYKIRGKLITKNSIREVDKIKKIINMEIDKLYKENCIDKLNFLYLEWFNKKEMDINIIYNNMKNKLKKEISEDEVKIYNIIKLSYNNV